MDACSQASICVKKALKRREYLLRHCDVPIQDEVLGYHGERMGNIILDNLTQGAKTLMGVGLHLRDAVTCPVPDSFDDAASQSSSKIRNLHYHDLLKSLTHEGIMKIGEQIEEKMEGRLAEKIKQGVKEISDFERYEYQQRLKFCLEKQEKLYKDVICNLQNEIEKLRSDFEKCNEEKKKDASYTVIVTTTSNDVASSTEEASAAQSSAIAYSSNNSESAEEIFEDYDGMETAKQLFEKTKKLWTEFEDHLWMQEHIMDCDHAADLVHLLCTEKLEYKRKLQMKKKKYSNQLKSYKEICECKMEHLCYCINEVLKEKERQNVESSKAICTVQSKSCLGKGTACCENAGKVRQPEEQWANEQDGKNCPCFCHTVDTFGVARDIVKAVRQKFDLFQANREMFGEPPENDHRHYRLPKNALTRKENMKKIRECTKKEPVENSNIRKTIEVAGIIQNNNLFCVCGETSTSEGSLSSREPAEKEINWEKICSEEYVQSIRTCPCRTKPIQLPTLKEDDEIYSFSSRDFSESTSTVDSENKSQDVSAPSDISGCDKIKEKILDESNLRNIVTSSFRYALDQNIVEEEKFLETLTVQLKEGLTKIFSPEDEEPKKVILKKSNESILGEAQRKKIIAKLAGKKLRMCQKIGKTPYEIWKSYQKIPKYMVTHNAILSGHWYYKEARNEDIQALVNLVKKNPPCGSTSNIGASEEYYGE